MIAIDDEIKKLFLQTSYPKNVRISFPYDNYDDLTNENIVAESLEFTENISNQIPLKFGLCEASRLLFDTIDVGNLKGKIIDVTIELEYKDKTYVIPYGRFVVESHKRKAYYNYIRHAECYSMENLLESTNTINNNFKNLLSDIKFKSNVKFHFSADELVCLSFPTIMGPLEIFSNEEYSFFFERTFNNYSVKYWVRKSNYISSYFTENCIFALHFNYQPEYILKAKELVEKIKSHVDDMGFDSLNSSFFSSFYTDYYENESNYTYHDINAISGGEYLYSLLNPINLVFPGFVFYNEERTKNGVYQTYLNASLREYFIPVKIEFYENSKLIYDTGFYNNTISIAKKNIDFLKNNEDKIFEISSSAKIIRMERQLNSTDSFTEVNRTVYMLDTKKLFDINIYDYLQANLELKGVFGKISRQYGTIEEIKLTSEGDTYPEDSVIPSDEQYMKTTIAQVYDTSMCIDYLFDDDEKKLYKSIICNYKNTAGEEATYEYVIRDMTRKTKSGEPVYNIIDYIDYDISDNYIIKSKSWTEEQIRNLLSPLANALENFTYTIGSAEAIGLPYIEAGDQIEVLTPDGGYITYIFSRTLRGIHSLRDTLTSE